MTIKQLHITVYHGMQEKIHENERKEENRKKKMKDLSVVEG